MASATVTTVYQASDMAVYDFVWAADADVTATAQAHALSGTPLEVTVTQRLAGSTAAGAMVGYTWTIDATNITLTKVGTFAGSAGTVRVVVRRLHHMGVLGS